MRISDWSSDVCSSDLLVAERIIDHEISWGSIYAADRPSPDDFHSSGATQSRVPTLDDIPPGGAAIVEHAAETLALRRAADRPTRKRVGSAKRGSVRGTLGGGRFL